MTRARLLLREADALLAGGFADLVPLAARGVRGGFATGAEWMRTALCRLREGRPVTGTAPFQCLGVLKYAVAGLAALAMLPAAWFGHWALLALTVPAFYAVEVQWVFLFSKALDGSQAPWRDSRALMRRRTGTVAAMLVVLPLAWRMLTGGLRGRGFVRSWCAGCLAVLLWYEQCLAPQPVATSAAMLPRLDLGGRAPLLLRREVVPLPLPAPLRLLYASDLHVRGAGDCELLESLGRLLTQTAPTAMVLGGDLADTRAGFACVATAVREWCVRQPVLVVPGNHDHWLGLESVRAAMLAAGAGWLPDGAFPLPIAGRTALWLAAPPVKPQGLLMPVVACLHDPGDFPAATAAGASFALAGHLHGGQCVLTERNGRLLPGAWFYRWNALRTAHDGCTLLVSRGCQDTLRVRWNCPREVLLCDITPAAATASEQQPNATAESF